MNTRDIVRRLKAFHIGRPLPCGSTRHFAISRNRDTLIIACVRMGGESRPWGIAYGPPRKRPKVLTVPEARNRDLVAAMATEFAPTLLAHLRTPGYVVDDPARWEDLAPLRQVWLPNTTHLDMLHHLAYAYAFTRAGGDRRERLRAFGRACGWLVREAHRSGTMAVMVGTQALRNAYTFPAEDARQAHLGFLMAWLEGPGSRDRRLAAALAAERRPISTSLDPDLERHELQPLVETWGEADREKRASQCIPLGKRIHRILARELRHRWDLTDRALALLRHDRRRENLGIEALVNETLREQWYQHTRLELKLYSKEDGPAFFPSPETDRHPAAAASRYLVYNASADFLESSLVHDDDELLAEAVASGDAAHGQIVAVRDEGHRGTKPVWTILDQADRQLRLRTASRVCLVGMPKRQGQIREFRESQGGGLLIDIEITHRKTRVQNAHGLSCATLFGTRVPDGMGLVSCGLASSSQSPG